MRGTAELGIKVSGYIWKREHDTGRAAALFQALRMMTTVVRDLREGHLNLRAMGLVYTTLLSIVPLLAISLSVLKGFGLHNEAAPVLRDLLAPLGEKGDEIAGRILEFVDNTRVGVLSSVGIVLLLYTALSVMQKVEGALNFIWHVERPRALSQRFSDYISVLLIGPVLVAASTGLSGAAMNNDVVAWLSAYEPIGSVIRLAALVVPLLLAFCAFSFIYILVPNTKVRPLPAMAGGITAAILWKLVGWAFALFVVSSGRYEAVYSAFATLIVFMVWLYASWLVLMVGAAVAFYHQNPAHLRVRGSRIGLSGRVKEKLALLAMRKLARDFYDGAGPTSLTAIADACRVPRAAAAAVVRGLEQAGLLVALGGDEPRYLPGAPLDATPLLAVLEAARSDEEDGGITPQSVAADVQADEAAAALQAGIAGALAGRTIKNLLGSGEDRLKN